MILLALGVCCAPLVAHAQQPGKVYRIGILEAIPAARNAVNLDALRKGLRDLDYVEGAQPGHRAMVRLRQFRAAPRARGPTGSPQMDVIFVTSTSAAKATKYGRDQPMIATRRSVLVALAALAASPVPSFAQAPARMRRVAWLGVGRSDAPSPYLEALRAGLSELGWDEGRNLALSRYWASGSVQQNMEPHLAREIVATDPEVIVTQEQTTLAVHRLRPETAIPVVFGFSGDPVDAGLVQSFARPGGNFTGISYLALDLVGKRIELLKEIVPHIRRIAILARPQHPGEHRERMASEEVVRKLGITLAYFPIGDVAELDKAFREIVQARCDALIVFPDAIMFANSERIARFATEAKLPAVSGWERFADGGLLLTYGPNLRDTYRTLARYVDRILRGTKPGELPVELPRSVELVVNARTAHALGVTVPQSILLRADRVIE